MLSIKYKARIFTNRTQIVIKRIERGALTGGRAAGIMYHKELRDLLLSKEGSRSLGGVRVREKFSDPGESPNWQSQNLGLSVKLSESKVGGKFSSRISSNALYAATVEFGGIFSTATKPFAKYKIIPEPLPARNMAARPAWVPTFMKLQEPMIKTISDSIKVAFQ